MLSALCSCSVSRRISDLEESGKSISLSLPSDVMESKKDVPADLKSGNESGRSVIMNAVLDSVTGDMVATDVIKASTVTARFRHAAERNGRVSLAFDVSVPPEMLESSWQLRLFPVMDVAGDSLYLEPLFITGSGYRSAQERGYQRYRAFLSSIIRDSTDFLMLHSLEIFIKRHFPETYSMKNDSSYVSEADAENLFGVSKKEVLEHYTRDGLIKRNDRRKRVSEKMLEKVLGPVKNKIRLDTVIYSPSGDLIYRYIQVVESSPGLKKIPVTVYGGIYELGKKLYSLPEPENIVFYISSLSTLADTSSRYVIKVIERNIYESKNAVIDFNQGSSEVDLTLYKNEEEFLRVRNWAERIFESEKFVADSVVVTASCSPEGRYRFNEILSKSRAESAMTLFSSCFPEIDKGVFRTSYIPENWSALKRMVSLDSNISDLSQNAVLLLDEVQKPDYSEAELKRLPEYGYIKEKIYPELRNVRFDIFMHRKGMQKDTIHTAETDTVYAAGLEALCSLDYKKAVEILGKYCDYNSALAYLSVGYDEKAWSIISGIRNPTSKSDYLAALVLSRLGKLEMAYSYFRHSVDADPSMLHRGRLDPEMDYVVKKYEIENH